MCLDRCSARACPANSLLFTVHSCLSKSSKCISTAQARRIWGPAAGASDDCALVVVPCAFSHMVVTFRGRRRETSCFGASKSTFRDRWKGSEPLYFEVQFSWQVQHFGHGGDHQGAQISWTFTVVRGHANNHPNLTTTNLTATKRIWAVQKYTGYPMELDLAPSGPRTPSQCARSRYRPTSHAPCIVRQDFRRRLATAPILATRGSKNCAGDPTLAFGKQWQIHGRPQRLPALACDFSGTAHSFMGATLQACTVEGKSRHRWQTCS